MDFETYYRSLPRPERLAFASRADTSCEYIEIHLLAKDLKRRKTPRKDLMERLAAASNGACSIEDIVTFFFLSAA